MEGIRRASVEMYLHPCHRTCLHCFATQGPAVGGVMRVDDFRRYTTRIHAAATNTPPLFSGWDLIPFADGLHHPEILQLMEHMETLGHTGLRGFSSDCWRIAHDPDWEHLLDRLRDFQVRSFQVTMYGMAETHDWFAGKRGSFAATECAVERLATRGFGVSWVVFLHERNVPEIDDLLGWIIGKTAEARVNMGTLNFRGRGEKYRDLAVSPCSFAQLSPLARSCFREELHTEEEWWQMAVEGRFVAPPRWERLRQAVLLLVSHEGAVTSGIDGRIPLGHLDRDSIADLVARNDDLVLPSYDEALRREEEAIAAAAGQPAPRSGGRLLNARNQLLLWGMGRGVVPEAC